jgi:hypothetical protein
MSTRWQIAAELSDGRCACIYVHCDGCPSYALKTLRQHYTDQQKIDRLIALGDCLSIAPEIESCETFYSRGGENWDDIKPTYGESCRDAADKHLHGDEEYRYFWGGQQWTQVPF